MIKTEDLLLVQVRNLCASGIASGFSSGYHKYVVTGPNQARHNNTGNFIYYENFNNQRDRWKVTL